MKAWGAKNMYRDMSALHLIWVCSRHLNKPASMHNGDHHNTTQQTTNTTPHTAKHASKGQKRDDNTRFFLCLSHSFIHAFSSFLGAFM
jgi:hypothetical protein